MQKVWILDNEEVSAAELAGALSTHAYDVTVWTEPELLIQAFADAAAEDSGHGGPDILVIEHGLERGDAIEVIRELRGVGKTPVVVVARRTSSQGAIDSMREGAYDYLPRETLPAGLEDAVRRALSADGGMIRTVGSPGPGDVADLGAIIGRTPEMVEIHKLIGQVAATDAPVLIHGESGTGKELIARAIHYNSDRRGRPFVAVNCAALPGELLEKELFGWETASGKEAQGRFELGRGGTIFLDEISETTPAVQGRLLTVMEDGFYERSLTRARVKTDVRIIAATGESLVRRMKEDRFRVDLFYRLKVVSLFMPPLRERRADIPILADHFLERTKAKMRKDIEGMTPAALEKLERHPWPGNVRELEQAMQHAVALCRTTALTPDDFDLSGGVEVGSAATGPAAEGDLARSTRAWFEDLAREGAPGISDVIVGEVEAVLAKAALESVSGNQVRAAKLLGISRNTLRKRLSRGEP
ncbi:MAG: sigma-54-dependent Fis family transcriptional regulator [Candidatus Eisenbacteria bacterium]|nr:sigma-54-dependent Fis family transcriptional regulator [Candidatus Eisenbacteria bacterium]